MTMVVQQHLPPPSGDAPSDAPGDAPVGPHSEQVGRLLVAAVSSC